MRADVRNKHPEKCVNCGKEIWLGAFFDGFFLCLDCDARKGEIIFKLKARLKKASARQTKTQRAGPTPANMSICPKCFGPDGEHSKNCSLRPIGTCTKKNKVLH